MNAFNHQEQRQMLMYARFFNHNDIGRYSGNVCVPFRSCILAVLFLTCVLSTDDVDMGSFLMHFSGASSSQYASYKGEFSLSLLMVESFSKCLLTFCTSVGRWQVPTCRHWCADSKRAVWTLGKN